MSSNDFHHWLKVKDVFVLDGPAGFFVEDCYGCVPFEGDGTAWPSVRLHRSDTRQVLLAPGCTSRVVLIRDVQLLLSE